MLHDVFDYINNTNSKTLRKELEECGVKFVERKDVGIVPKIRFRGKPTNPIDLDALPEYADWIKDGWVYGYLIGKDVIVGEIVEFEDDYFNTEFWCRVKPETVGQFTGLKDENGKGIYEGDIIKSKRNVSYDAYKRGEFKIYVGYVKYIAGSGRYILTDLKGWDVDALNRTHFPEVIGNIYDNPELLRSEADA